MSGYTTVAAASMRDAAGNALNGAIANVMEHIEPGLPWDSFNVFREERQEAAGEELGEILERLALVFEIPGKQRNFGRNATGDLGGLAGGAEDMRVSPREAAGARDSPAP